MDAPDRKQLYDDLTDAIYRIDQLATSLTMLAGRLVMIRNKLSGLDWRSDEERRSP